MLSQASPDAAPTIERDRRSASGRSALILLGALALACLALVPAQVAGEGRYFAVQVLDSDTGRGVPLIELKTNNNITYVTDSAGVAAINEPSLTGIETFFHVSGHGYELSADGFGIRGVRLTPTPGGRATVRVNRLNIAERLYRVTGAGIYRDSLLAGQPAPVSSDAAPAQVMGCDSVQNVIYRGRLWWFWGDTTLFHYPLGNFHGSGATTPLPPVEGFDPDRQVKLDYLLDEQGRAREVAPIPGPGPTWIDALVALGEGDEVRMYCAYSKIRPPLEVYQRGLARFDDEKGLFTEIQRLPVDAPIIPFGHPAIRREGGRAWIYFGDPFPLVRTPASEAGLRDLSQYESFSPLAEGSTVDRPVIARGTEGLPLFAWRRGTPLVNPEALEKLVEGGHLNWDDAPIGLREPHSGKPLVIHRGTVNWNEHRRRWVLIGTQIRGSSMLGEVWYAEASTPQGPWKHPRKIVSHNRYSFYNPAHHAEFDRDGGRLIYFEGTYTHAFSGNDHPTPRYDYNQIMYRLDLDHPRLALPAVSAPSARQ